MKFIYNGNHLVCDEPIPGVTQELSDQREIEYYKGRFFICETISESAARIVSVLLYKNQEAVLGSLLTTQYSFVKED